MNEGVIETTVFTNQLGQRERIDYKWIGDSKICAISGDLAWDLFGREIKEGDEINIGPFRLAVIEHKGLANQYFRCVRKDYPFWWVLVGWHRLNRVLELIYSRIIITLAVWNLAEYKQHTHPHWRDIYLIQWIEKKLKRD